MKFAFAVVAIVFTSSVFAADFHAVIDDVECSIVNGKVTRVSSFGKEFIGSFKETKTVELAGLAPFIRKVSEVSSQLPHSTDTEYRYTMTHEGKSYSLNTRDSIESSMIVRMISRICR